MRVSRSVVVLTAGAALAVTAPSAGAAPPEQTGNCVSYVTSAIGQAGIAGAVISGGAHELQPFGATTVSVQAHSSFGSCPYTPGDFGV